MKRVRTVSVGADLCQVASFDPKAVTQARRALPGDETVRAVAERLAALGTPTRLALLLALEGRELCVCDCAQVLGGSVSSTSQHLKELRRLGAITFRSAGKMAYYRIADPQWLAVVRTAAGLAGIPVWRKASA
jgi:DNA-binding transcriptional ArsR family regulator